MSCCDKYVFGPPASGSGGISTINGNSNSSQTIAAGTGINVSSSLGTTTITATGGGSGITEINSDTHAHQTIQGDGSSISVSTVSGVTTISNSEPFTGAITSINGDTTEAQTISGDETISASTSGGTTTISAAYQGNSSAGIVLGDSSFSSAGIYYWTGGISTATSFPIFYSDGSLLNTSAGQLQWIAPGSEGQVLTMVGTNPAWV